METTEHENRPAVLQAFGATIRSLRSEKALSQEEFADRCGLDRTYIGGVERGERNIGLLNICRIAQALQLDVSAIFLRIEVEN